MPPQITDSLRQHFEWLCRELETAELNERDLSAQAVAIRPIKVSSEHRTLLETLGYDNTTAKSEFGAYRIGARIFKVDFLLGGTGNYWMLDLKKPKIECARQAHIEQLQFYMKESNVSLGVLYNGLEAVAIVNPNHKDLSRYRDIHEQLRKNPVLKTGRGSPVELAEFFAGLSCHAGVPNAQEIVRRLAKKYMGNLRLVRIAAEVARLLREPPAELALAIIGVSEDLRQEKANVNEVRIALEKLRRGGTTAQISAPTLPQHNLPGLPDMIKSGIIQPSDRLFVLNKEKQTATVIDGKQVEFNGYPKTCNQWAAEVTGWSTINIYNHVVHERTGKKLCQLRRDLQSSFRMLPGKI